MKREELTVHGDDAWTVPRAVQDVARDDRFDYDGDGFAVVVVEEYYYRNLSSLQTTLLFDLVDETTCEITLVAGGASAGLARYDADAEGESIRRLVRKFETYCRDEGLTLER